MNSLYSNWFYTNAAKQIVEATKLSFAEKVKNLFVGDRQEEVSAVITSMHEAEREAFLSAVSESSKRMMAQYGQEGYFVTQVRFNGYLSGEVTGEVNGKEVTISLDGRHSYAAITPREGEGNYTRLGAEEAMSCYYKYIRVAVDFYTVVDTMKQILKNNNRFPQYKEAIEKEESEKAEREESVKQKSRDEAKLKEDRLKEQKEQEILDSINKEGIVS